jgi:hypothetical protein
MTRQNELIDELNIFYMTEAKPNDKICIGKFDLKKSKIILDTLEKNNIQFEIEIDDSEIKNLTPLQAQGGTFGLGVYVSIFVNSQDEDVSLKLLDEFL